MSICIYTCMYVCVCVCVYLYIYTYIHTSTVQARKGSRRRRGRAERMSDATKAQLLGTLEAALAASSLPGPTVEAYQDKIRRT